MAPRPDLHSIYIDALALVPSRKSGIGMSIHHTVQSLTSLIGPDDHVYLVVPLGKARYLQAYSGPKVSIKTIPLPARVMEVLLRLRLMPPVDWLMGTGIYIFPNYRNWPLWRSRSLTYVYDMALELYPETIRPNNRRYLRRYIRRWTGRTDKVITISNQVRNEIEKHLAIPAYKIAVVPCGVDRSSFRRRPMAEVKKIKAEYGVKYENYLLFVGNIEPRKNLMTLLRAYEMLPEKTRQDYGLVIVGGDGWLNEAVFKTIAAMQASGLSVMKVDAYVTNDKLAALYSGARLLVHPASYEGFGMTPLEALSCETPSVVADIPVMHEILDNAAYYAKVSNAPMLAKSITQALSAPREAMLAPGRERVRLFDWRQTAEALLQAIDEQRRAGPRHALLLTALKNLYRKLDQGLRDMLGERTLAAYRPHLPANKTEAYRKVCDDFIAEQPTLIQSIGLTTYLRLRHSLTKPLKILVRRIRSRA